MLFAFKSISQVIVAVTVSTLGFGLLPPVQIAEASQHVPQQININSSSYDSLAKNIDISTSHEFIGDSRDIHISVKLKSGTTLPKERLGDEYEIHLYELTTGKHVVSSEFTPSKESKLELETFIPVGTHEYRAFITDGAGATPPESLDDLPWWAGPQLIGGSNIITWERKPFKLTLTAESSEFDILGSRLTYSLNQEINGHEYAFNLYNITTGNLVRDYGLYQSEETYSGISFPHGNPNQFQVVLAKQNDGNSWETLDEIPDIAAYSNLITLKRMPWKVETYLAADELGVFIYEGGGEYGAYVAERNTGEIVGYQRHGFRAYFDNKDHGDDISWAIVYIAQSFNEDEGEEMPQHVSELKDIIADSDGLVDDVTGVQQANELAGGRNLNEICNVECHGDPINSATGEFFDNKTDLLTIGGGLTPTVERSFSTLNKDDLNYLGYGWRVNYEMNISSSHNIPDGFAYDPGITTSRYLELKNENGSVSPFYRKNDGTFKSKTSTLATLDFNPEDNTFTLQRLNTKETFTFNSNGNLIRINNNNNQIITLDYDMGKLSTVHDNAGNSITFTYNNSNLISSLRSNNGKEVTYSYNTSKRLTKVVDESGVTYSYTYDSSGRVRTLTNELGGTTTNSYNASNQVTKQVDPLGNSLSFTYQGEFDPSYPSVTTIKYPNGKVVEETYLGGNIVKKEEKAGKSIRTWQYSYNEKGNLSSTILPDMSSESFLYDSRGNIAKHFDAKRNVTSLTYDSNDNLVSIKDALGNETFNEYDSRGNLTATITPLNERTTFEYNDKGLLEKSRDARGNSINADPNSYSISYSYLPNGLLSSQTDAAQGQTTLTYDTHGNIISTTDARGEETTASYNSQGLPTSVLDSLGNESALTYDKMGNILTSKNANNDITSYTYDSLGNMLTKKDASGNVISYAYDNMSQPIRITFADGSVQNILYNGFGEVIEIKDSLSRATKQEWDSAGNLIASIDAAGGRTEYTYDSEGNITSTKTPAGSILTAEYNELNQLIKTRDSLGRTTEMHYDANGRVIEIKNADNTSVKNVYDSVGNTIKTIDEEGHTKQYAYDELNRKVSYQNEIGQITHYSYDMMSNLISETRPDGSIANYEYDSRNLLTKVDYPETQQDITYLYDSLGRKVSETKGEASPVFYIYDELNRITSVGKTGNKVEYAYDIGGNVQKVTYPSGRVTEYEYDAVAQPTSMRSDGIAPVVNTYNLKGLLTSTTLPNGITEQKEYDNDGRLTSTELISAVTNSSLYKKTQQYNLVGEVIQKGVFVDGTNTALEDFIYDPLSRLTQQRTTDTEEIINNYSYSSSGNLNIINENQQMYDSAGKLITTGLSNLTYDARSNRTGIIDENNTKNVEYDWNEDNTLSGVTTHPENSTEATEITYEYSPDKLLSARTHDEVRQEFVWDVNRAVPVMLSDGQYEYLYKSMHERIPFAQVELSTGVVTYLHSDLTGSIIATTGASGELIGTVDYSPYGKPTGLLLSAFGYAGEWTDKDTGYNYLRMRWLDTLTGTFLSEDPWTQITNKAFDYTEGNPITQIDPLGLFFQPIDDWLRKDSTINILSDISTVTGTVAAVTGMMGLVPTPLSPFFMAISGISTAASLSTGAVATIGNCRNAAVVGDPMSNDSCRWGIATTAVGVVPFVKPLAGPIKKLNTLARTRLPFIMDEATSLANTHIMGARISGGAIQFAAPVVDVVGRWKVADKYKRRYQNC